MPKRREFLAHAFTALSVGVFGTGRKALASPAPRQDPSPFLGRNPGEERTVEGMKLCWCPPGQFVMGSPPTETGRNVDEAQVPVTITRGFWMAKFEVTQGRWTRVMGALPKTPPTAEFGLGDEHPVYWVSYGDAETFCRTLTEGALRAGSLPDGWEFRLPTEAQWEYACRAGTVTATAFGDSLGLRQANFNGEPLKPGKGGNALGRATSVGSYPANPWGLCDMHGNVFEWCRDWYHARLPGGTDPDLSETRGIPNRDGTYSRVRRGGAWNDSGRFCRSALRLRYEPERNSDHIGFRVAAVPRAGSARPQPAGGRV
jgi:formylglycine-generating enzyme required for sulfatase activity